MNKFIKQGRLIIFFVGIYILFISVGDIINNHFSFDVIPKKCIYIIMFIILLGLTNYGFQLARKITGWLLITMGVVLSFIVLDFFDRQQFWPTINFDFIITLGRLLFFPFLYFWLGRLFLKSQRIIEYVEYQKQKR